ncbi:DUF429 domain-containing protein [Nocardiopsis sp. N85]|uniref:DUF429 domain-containing protein n=1 Tax=Nocardiopsis sp. N85 TaxID=3029400 RepID=UPI00237F0DE8|nr:DUF429 domain-containing protein [Nocardiopsis sp. N85]MDE3723551.1 DUF429 domain-containing protein [Nocardiopsis sp. N85]
MDVVGIDGCPKGWVAVRLVDGRFDGARFCPTLAEATSMAGTVAVDIPLGLVDHGWRECDGLVSALLKGHASSVFRIPPRRVVEADGYEAANALCRELTGKGLSRQSHALFPRILEADALREAGVPELHEVHPELSFRVMAGRPLRWSKKTWNGQAERRRLLDSAGILPPDDLAEAGSVPLVDVLDATAAAWSAHRVATGAAGSHPDPPQLDGAGGPVAIRC